MNTEAVHTDAAFKAAQYVRMSTEHQQYSTHNQADKIKEYADKRGIEIVKTYADEGKSGLSIGDRAALQRLISDVENGLAEFNVILVYDVSRWGRFQDADESAYYEYICRRAGIQVAYCAEQFENDGSPVSTIVKGVKRAMAGEYSRELSAKVFAGQCRLIELGFRQGGAAGFGLRRVLIDERGETKGVLKQGEHKSLQTDRVILMPGPIDEVAWVNQMFRWVIDADVSFREIALRLNDAGVETDLGRPWTNGSVRTVLTNEKYIGINVYNRHSFKLKKQHVDNPPEMWIRKEGAFDSIVAVDLFMTVQEIVTARSAKLSDEELLEHLKRLHAEQGQLSGVLINQSDALPSANTYRTRFESLRRAYELIVYKTNFDQERAEMNARLRAMYPEIVEQTVGRIRGIGGDVKSAPDADILLLNKELRVSLILARCQTSGDGRYRWRVRFDPEKFAADLSLVVRLDHYNEAALDYCLLPWLDLPKNHLAIEARNASDFEAFRFDDLGFFYGMAARAQVWKHAS